MARPLIICLRCGGWAERNPVHLLHPCPGSPHQGGRQAFRRIARGLHPSYYGKQPPVRAVVPFAINEELIQQIRNLRPHVRSTIPVPLISTGASSLTLARLERLRSRKAQREQEGTPHELPQAASSAGHDPRPGTDSTPSDHNDLSGHNDDDRQPRQHKRATTPPPYAHSQARTV